MLPMLRNNGETNSGCDEESNNGKNGINSTVL